MKRSLVISIMILACYNGLAQPNKGRHPIDSADIANWADTSGRRQVLKINSHPPNDRIKKINIHKGF